MNTTVLISMDVGVVVIVVKGINKISDLLQDETEENEGRRRSQNDSLSTQSEFISDLYGKQ